MGGGLEGMRKEEMSSDFGISIRMVYELRR